MLLGQIAVMLPFAGHDLQRVSPCFLMQRKVSGPGNGEEAQMIREKLGKPLRCMS